MNKFSLSSLTSKSSSAPSLGAWRVDFRKTAELPDVKVIRTDFLLNYGLAALAVAALIYAGYREMEYNTLRGDILMKTAELESRRAKNDSDLKSSGEFTAYMRYADAFAGFKRPVPVDSLAIFESLGEVAGDKIVFKSILVDVNHIDLVKKKSPTIKVMLTGSVKGTSSLEFKQVEDSYERLKSLSIWSEIPGYAIAKSASKSPTSVSPNTQDQIIDFTFELPLEQK